MASDIVPIELGLTDGPVYTLWAPRWRDGEDEWEAFLGLDEDLYGFTSVAELVAFVRSDKPNDLDDHPAWEALTTLPAEAFVPRDDRSFDVISVPELAAEEPTPEVIAELEDTLEIVGLIGEVCELIDVTKFFNGNPVLGTVRIGTRNFEGREGAEMWHKVGQIISRKWDDVIDAIEGVVSAPKVSATLTEAAEEELAAAEEKAAALAADTEDLDDDLDDVPGLDTDDLDEDDDEFDEDDAADDEAVDAVEDDEEFEDDDSFWGRVGIDPIKIITSTGEYYTLRCYLDDNPIFLGRKGKIFAFDSEGALARYLADDNDTDLSTVSTYQEVQVAATDGSLEVEVYDDNVYVLPGISEDIADGPRRIDRDQLDLAVELLLDSADFADDASVREALRPTTPLGFFVSYALDPQPRRLAPSGPFDNEVEAWRALEHDFEDRLTSK
ncbi:primosomal protein [Tsukamurella pseudospumae]|uniref:Primosomal protein n=1 Tax=Tsukamurella pseudospumae TaxID=239498 RepID=A0A138ANW6_9ACTN|nr:primosomal protein [Tsukamurella pseudospumae]KXP00852.1 primosomal protein [Tsukamurella pseudospumae]KXP12147.1 primosomal protein [Tsukamurella pseudospumae]